MLDFDSKMERFTLNAIFMTEDKEITTSDGQVH